MGSADQDGTSAGSRPSGLRAWLLLLLGLYAVTGVVGLERTLTPDEIRPLILASRSYPGLMENVRQDIIHTPLSFTVTAAWMKVFGVTDMSVKIMALLVGAAAIALFTILASRVTPSYRLASLLFCMFFLRIGSPVNLVRMYGLLVVFVLLAMLAFERWRRQGGVLPLLGWIAAMTLAVYTHPSALLLLPAFAVVNLFFGRRRFTFPFLAVIPVVALVPWLSWVYPVYAERGIESNVPSFRAAPHVLLGWLPYDLLSGEEPGGGSPEGLLDEDRVRRMMKWPARLVFALLALGAIVGLVLRSRREELNRLMPPALLGLAPLLILLVFSYLHAPVIQLRYLMIALPAFCLSVAALVRLGGWVNRAVVSLLILPWMAVSAVIVGAERVAPSLAREGMVLVGQEYQETDVVVCGRTYPLAYPVYWEWRRRLGERGRFETIDHSWIRDYNRSVIPGKSSLEELDLTGAGTIWFFFLLEQDQSQLESAARVFGEWGYRLEVPQKSRYLAVFKRADAE